MNKRTLNSMKLTDIIFEGKNRYEIGIIENRTKKQMNKTIQIYNIRKNNIICIDLNPFEKYFNEILPKVFDPITKVRLNEYYFFTIQNGQYSIYILNYKGPVNMPKSA